jgi:hypothetical protein
MEPTCSDHISSEFGRQSLEKKLPLMVAIAVADATEAFILTDLSRQPESLK